MALDRGTLAKIDRRVFAELEQVASTQAVKIPLSDAAWSTWRRYCQAIGLTMGEGVAGLIEHELRMVVGKLGDVAAPLFAARREEELAVRESGLATLEQDLAATEKRLSEWTERLGTWERELRARERRFSVGSEQAPATKTSGGKAGRNEPCPCGSGRKYKRCHGSPARHSRIT